MALPVAVSGSVRGAVVASDKRGLAVLFVSHDLAVIRSCWADSVNHPQAVYQMNTGSTFMGRPSLGSWVGYGLGTENRDLPAFVVLPDPSGGIIAGASVTIGTSALRLSRALARSPADGPAAPWRFRL